MRCLRLLCCSFLPPPLVVPSLSGSLLPFPCGVVFILSGAVPFALPSPYSCHPSHVSLLPSFSIFPSPFPVTTPVIVLSFLPLPDLTKKYPPVDYPFTKDQKKLYRLGYIPPEYPFQMSDAALWVNII